MTDPTAVTPAGWYPDPAGGGRSRWWDGAQWTEHYHDPYAVGVQAAALKAPEGTVTNTPWIWLIILLPLVSFIPLALIPWGSMFEYDLDNPYSSINSSMGVLLSPGYILTLVLSPIIYGLSALFAYQDHKTLTARGVPQPFHWAWVFLSSLVYVIGRSVVVRRRTGQGFAPFWAAMGTIALSLIFSIWLMVVIFTSAFESLSELSNYPGMN